MSIKNVVNSRLAEISTYDGDGKVTGLDVGNIVANAITSTGNVTANGLSINGGAIITGNANIQGNLTYNNITNLTTSNLVLGLGNNQSGINVTGGGIVVGNTAEAQFLYNQPTSTWNTNLGITANGNITGSYIIGNGSQLTGLPAGYTNTDVTNLLSAGNVSNNIITTGNVSGTYFLGNGSQLTGLPATYGNANVTNLLSSGNVSSNVITTANVNGAVLNATTSVFSGVDITTGNIANANVAKTRIVSFGANSYIQTGNGTALSTGNIIFAPYLDTTNRVRIDTSSGNLHVSGNIFDQTGQVYGVPASYYYAGFATQPANAVTGGTIIFNGKYESFGSGISYNSGTGVFTLQPGTYSLAASLALANQIGNSELDYVWAYAGNSVAIGSTAGALLVNSTANAAFQTLAQGVITVATPTQVKLYVAFGGGAGLMQASMGYGFIEQIGGQSPITNIGTQDYLQATRITSDQTLVTLNSDLIYNNIVTQATGGNLSFNTSTGVVTLKAGVTYELTASASWINYSTNTGFMTYGFVNANNNSLINGLTAVGEAYTTTTAVNNSSSVTLIYTPVSDEPIKVRVVNASGTVSLRQSLSFFTVKQLGGYIPAASSAFVTKGSGLVNAGVDVQLGNLKARIPTSGNRSLQVSTVSGTYSVYGSCTYAANGAPGASIISDTGPVSVTTTPTYLKSNMSFGAGGDICTWLIFDTSQGISWRISMILGQSFNNNMISIERLV